MNNFKLGKRSIHELEGVNERLVSVVEHALSISTQDFIVFDGLRTLDEQQEMVRSGASTTLASKHMRQPDGTGHAVDLVPWLNGKPRWEWPLIYPIAAAMHEAAREEGVPIRWGGVWDMKMWDYQGGLMGVRRANEDYVKRRLMEGKRVFTDGPHYELV